MVKIVNMEPLNPTLTKITLEAPHIAKKVKAGQFGILRVDEDGERFPLTIEDWDIEKGTISFVFQIVGGSTERMNHKKPGEYIADVVGPLGNPTDLEGDHICVVAGGSGCAIGFPVIRELHKLGKKVDAVIGFRNKDLVVLENEIRALTGKCVVMTDDGSYATKGLVTEGLQSLIDSGEKYDKVITLGPLPMMKFVCQLTKKYGIHTLASMNPIMVDGTGMCGGCRLTVGGETRFACVDGPEFDGHLIDFDEAMCRSTMYQEFELHERDEACNLFHKEVK
ncbi:MAG: sulfide/dihydroorotate dehydrogenase-like FAD/NAD-binding protein [Oscillospiraceae bacterium]|nr:sulfide/dihydroorotate dehydrogenase-like FAD/NAD-binding protein [Oscillospiraceae bacterium]